MYFDLFCHHRAEDAVDKVLSVHPSVQSKASGPSRTLQTHLVGHRGYSNNLEIVLVQEYGISIGVAHRLVRAYGGRAWDVLQIAKELPHPVEDLNDRLLVPGYPYLEAEVVFAARHDWACHAEDVLARRTRLAFLNKDAAVKVVPRVVQLLGRELLWDDDRQRLETRRCIEYLRHFGGPHPVTAERAILRTATMADIKSAYRRINEDFGFIAKNDVVLVGEMLNHPLSDEEIQDLLQYAKSEYKLGEGQVSFSALSTWWNSERCNPLLVKMKQDKMATAKQVEGSGTLFG